MAGIPQRLAGLIELLQVTSVSNALAEGFNSKIQSIKSAARGFRSFKNSLAPFSRIAECRAAK